MRLFLVRHGETEHNRRGIALGRADVPLNDTGRAQAESLARHLAGEPLAAVYSSPLQRAFDTAFAIAEPHGIEVTVEYDLIEMDVGEVDGLTFVAVREQYPGFIERWMSESGPEHPMPGGERLLDVADRAWLAISRLAELHHGQSVVAVSHNFVILTLLARALGMDLANFRRLRHGVAAVSILEVRPDGARVVSINDTCHLPPSG